MEQNITNMRTNKGTSWSQNQHLRAAAISIALVVFLFAFRPFGLTIDSAKEALVLMGIAPLNFLIITITHALPIREPRWQGLVSFGSLLAGNTAYIIAWSQDSQIIQTGIAVALVVSLVASIIYLWNRGRLPEQALDRPASIDDLTGTSFTLSGDGDQEILKMAANELLFMRANGNYVVVHYLKDRAPTTAMLRSSLARMAAQVPGNHIVQSHRSHFVNLTVARQIVRSKGRTLIEFDDGQRAPISRTFRQNVLDAISA